MAELIHLSLFVVTGVMLVYFQRRFYAAARQAGADIPSDEQVMEEFTADPFGFLARSPGRIRRELPLLHRRSRDHEVDRLRRYTLGSLVGVAVATFAGASVGGAVEDVSLGGDWVASALEAVMVAVTVLLVGYWLAQLIVATRSRRSVGWIAVCVLGIVGSIFALLYALLFVG